MLANTVSMYHNNQITLSLPDLQDKKSFTLLWDWFFEDSSIVVASIFAH